MSLDRRPSQDRKCEVELDDFTDRPRVAYRVGIPRVAIEQEARKLSRPLRSAVT